MADILVFRFELNKDTITFKEIVVRISIIPKY